MFLAALQMPRSEAKCRAAGGIEQMNLIHQLDDDDRTVVFKITDAILAKKKVKKFFLKDF